MGMSRRAGLAALARRTPACPACADRRSFLIRRDVDGTPLDERLRPIAELSPPEPCAACGRPPLMITLQYVEHWPGGLS